MLKELCGGFGITDWHKKRTDKKGTYWSLTEEGWRLYEAIQATLKQEGHG